MDKKRIAKDYDTLPEEIINQVKMAYPEGFSDNLVSYMNKDGKKVSALPFETDETYYLIRMTIQEAEQIIEDDDDYDDDGNLRDDFGDDEGASTEVAEDED
jgi:DNA-directed RNA polymerase subunit delta